MLETESGHREAGTATVVRLLICWIKPLAKRLQREWARRRVELATLYDTL
jgi:hypothetical protein